jgi:DNA-binding PadR family transcriptional regulator
MKSLASDYEVFFSSAALSAHAVSPNGFRQRDLKFFVELFSNWVETSLEKFFLTTFNAQVARYLGKLEKEGFAQKRRKGSVPIYKITRVGMSEILKGMTERDYSSNPAQFLFVSFFIRNYRDQILNLVANEGTLFPKILQQEIESFLDPQRFIDKQRGLLDKSIARLKLRLDDAEKISLKVRHGVKHSIPEEDLLTQIEKEFPYELNNQKPFSELLRNLPPDQRKWELFEGARLRGEELFLPLLEHLMLFRKQIDRITSRNN